MAEHIRTCPLCEATCGLSLRVEDGQVTRVRGDRHDVFSRGFICPKGSVLHHIHEDPDRLRRPLVRDDATGELVEASWRDAIAEAGRRLRAVRDEHGPGALAVYIGNPNAHSNGLFSLQALIGSLGTLNVFSASSVDQLAREVANGHLYGDPHAWGVPDLDRTDQVLLLGANPVVSGGSLATAPDWPGRLAAVRARGGRVIVVDPRRTETAEVADEWIPIRPGTDAHLLAAVARLLLESPGGVDLGPAGAWIDGVDRLPALLEPFTVDAVAARTGIPEGTIRGLAEALAAPTRTAVHGRVGLQTSRFGTLASWLSDVVVTLSGNLDRPGGTMFARPAVGLPRLDGGPFTTGRWDSPVGGHPECRGELPVAALPDEILTDHPGRIRALVCLAGNPVVSGPDSRRMDEAFAALDAVVSIDIYRTETNRHADVVLPPPSHLERSHYDVFFYPMAVRNTANWSPPLFEPTTPTEQDLHLRLAAAVVGLPEADDAAAAANVATVGGGLLGMLASLSVPGADAAAVMAGLDGDSLFDQIIDLGLRVGPYGAGLPWVDGAPPPARPGDDGLSLTVLRANPHGIDLGPLEPALPERLQTASGRIDLASPPIAADLPRLVADLVDTAPQMTLVGRRQLRSNNSWMHNIRVLMKGRARCTLLVHPDDASALGLTDGGTARVTSATGSVDAPVEVTDAIAPGVVSLPHGWGHVTAGQAVANAQPGVNSNILTDPTAIDPLSGTCSINGIAVTVTPAATTLEPVAAHADR